jgi:hypothetical protein
MILGDEERRLTRELVVEYAAMGDEFTTVFDFIKEDLTDPRSLNMTKETDKLKIRDDGMYYENMKVVDILERQKDYAYIVWVNVQKITNPEWGMRPYI